MAEERVNRKLAAILAADVVGYSRLMGADEAGTCPRSLSCLRFSCAREAPRPAVSIRGRRHLFGM